MKRLLTAVIAATILASSALAAAGSQYYGYSAGVLAFSPAASATDIFAIVGSASKTIYVSRMCLHGTQTTLGTVAIQVVKRSTDNTGGTSTAPTRVAHDSQAPAATAVVRVYTANPSALGTLVGVVSADREQIPAVASAVSSRPVCYEFGTRDHPVVLRSASELLAINLNGVTVTGGSFAAYVTWSEE